MSGTFGEMILRAIQRPLRWWVVIAEWEQGLRVRFGKNTKELQPGLHFRIPFVDRIYVEATRERTVTVDNVTLMSKDGKVFVANIAITFAVESIKAVYNSMSTPEMTMMTRVRDDAVTIVSKRLADDVSPETIRLAVPEESPPGIGPISLHVTSMSRSRSYRILSEDYFNGAGLGSLEPGEEWNGGERR